MGRSSSSCLRIIACGSDSADKDHPETSEGKSSNDKRGWSFRKRSARHRVLSNTVISERPSSGVKESPESDTFDFQTQPNSAISEKTAAMQWADEKLQLSTSLDSKSSKTTMATEDETKTDVTLDESVVVVIQAGIRGFLAQRVLLKHKNIIKLQAAVRGHLVRRHAVGTLRCVQAIVKMQALVRARRARRLVEELSAEEKRDENHGKDNQSSKLLGKENLDIKPHVTYTPIEKLLRNKFARQLLRSIPRTKSTNIKCDPSKSDSAWKWLERWMSISSTGMEESQKLESSTVQQEQEGDKKYDDEVEATVTSKGYCGPVDLMSATQVDLMSGTQEAAEPCEGKENLITYDAESFDFPVYQPTSSSVNHNLQQPQLGKIDMPNLREDPIVSLPNQPEESNSVSTLEASSVSGSAKMDLRHSLKMSPEQPGTEAKKFVFGSRKASNPSFIAAQSKFEELSSSTNLTRSVGLSNQDTGAESCADAVSSATDNAFRTGVTELAENSETYNSRVQVGGSECGTELSISSTLDSPDRSEVGAVDFEQEARVPEDVISNPKRIQNIDDDTKCMPTLPRTDLSHSISVEPEKHDNGGNGEAADSAMALDSSWVEQEPEKSASDVQRELELDTDHRANKSSPEGSPRSHITVPESEGTPSSQISVKAKKMKSEKSGSSQKFRSISAGKRSPSNPNQDSGARSSLEQLSRTGKRRNSFGLAKPNHVDQEPRDSSSSNSLPNYMQATESTRAKSLANSSPISSPDVQDKDIYVKKRHSLPGANVRQGSPRIQPSMTQALQGTKGNGIQPHERKWQR